MTSQYWRLCDDVHATSVSGDVVFLDVARGAYHCSPGLGEAVEIRTGQRGFAGLSGEMAAELQASGLIVPAESPPPENPRPAPSVSGEVGDLGVRPSLGECAQFAACVASMGWRYHGRSFAALVSQGRRRRPSRGGEKEAALGRRVEAYRALLPFAPGQGVCLYRAFLLLTYLRAGGLDAQWVFGVRTWPFYAHCWLQQGERALDDPADYVSRFTPILVV